MAEARVDPFRGFRFLVEMEGLVIGAFTRVKGLSRELKYESYREGGVNDYEHRLVTGTAYPAIVLERGFALDDLWRWALAASDGEVTRRTFWIRLLDEAGAPAWSWEVTDAIPVKWSASDLEAQASQVVVESIELAHQGLRRAA